MIIKMITDFFETFLDVSVLGTLKELYQFSQQPRKVGGTLNPFCR